MDSLPVTLIAWAAVIGSGLMAGVYLSFSGFIMKSFANLDTERAIDAMNAINATILRSAFMPLFFGSTVISLLLIAVGIWHWGHPGAGRALIAGLTYFVGMFVVTAACNVPLNNALARVGGSGDEARSMWQTYLTRWTRWNTVRAAACTLSFVVSIALLAH